MNHLLSNYLKRVQFNLLLRYIISFVVSGQNNEELSANANERLKVVENPGDGWLRVRKGDQEGYVPESYVKLE